MSYLYTKTSSSHLQAYPLDNTQKAGIGLSVFGLLILIATLFDVQLFPSVIWLVLSIVCILAGVTVYSVFTYKKMPAGIKNNGIYHISLTNRGLLGWIAGVMLTAFYVLLYWFPQGIGLGTDGESNTRLVALFDPLSMWIKNQPASEWFVYGTLYTLAILSFGIKFILKYWHNRYQLYRTIVVIFCQLFLAYIIPEIMEGLSDPEKYFAKDLKFFWPLNYYFFDAWHINNMTASGSLGMVFLVWGIVGVLLVTPVLTYFLGKRWYCSWVCGCGGLAETAGDPFRHLSNKTMESWRLERILIYSILGFIIIVTGVVLYGYFSGSGSFLGLDIYSYFSRPYAFFIGAAFSGVIGVGFYPILGNRVWCRFGCPLAAYMGIIQRFKSRFRITTNGGQCISCGNCSTYCEMGIDVRSYAQRKRNIVRASCVGCGICSAVCPRGVLKLENGPLNNRLN